MSFSGRCKRCSSNRSFLAALLALSLVWQAPAPAIAQPSCDSVAVAVAPQSPGQPLSDDVVRLVDASGPLLDASFGQPRSVMPTPKPGVALLRSLGGIYALLDAGTGTVTPVQIPNDVQMQLEVGDPTTRNAPRSDFMLLVKPLDQIWLLDLTSGDAIDLQSLLPGETVIEFANVSPDGNQLLFFSDGAAYLIDLRSLVAPESLDSLPVLPYPGFSADGARLRYAVRSPSGLAIVRSLDLTSGERTDLAVVPGIQRIDVNPDGPLLLFDGDTLLALAEGAATPEPIYTWTGSVSGVLADAAGAHAVIGDRVGDVSTWHWVDTATGETRVLAELEEMQPLPVREAQNQIIFTPGPADGEGTPGAPYRTLDLTTGTVVTPLAQDSGEVWMASSAGDDAGRYYLVNAVSPGSGRMWLIDAQAGTSQQIGSSTGNLTASVSPDGCQLALDTFDTLGEGRTSTVVVSSVADGSPIAQLSDSLLLGWAPST